ncbi:helix-turn-helix transcriptional regulator [Ramlibacter sp.]|uniref:helix-turn-helix transcriptional regulator n=1 Tax=Ramlibacter sp. TaxID=1917967 RepID=UPI003D0D9301
MSNAPPGRYRGDFVAWAGVCGFLGEGGGGTIAEHSHYAIQLATGLPHGLRVRSGRDGRWHACAAALIPSKAPHTIDVTACEMSVVLFIEPETPAGRALSSRMEGELELLDAGEIELAAARLSQAWRVERDAEAVRVACMQLVEQISGTAHREPSDPRVLAVVDHIRRHVDQPVGLADVSRLVHLSPERFRHLFVEQTGMPLRTYVLWRRLLHVYSLLMQGENLSVAAHAAGFSDSAHLSRTARTMFGLPPSSLQMSGPLSARASSANAGKPSHFA